jgi:hypothetical protein
MAESLLGIQLPFKGNTSYRKAPKQETIAELSVPLKPEQFKVAYIAFKKANTNIKGFLGVYNKAVKWFTGEYTHCELAFKTSVQSREYRCLRIIMNSPKAHWIARKDGGEMQFSNDSWDLFRILLTEDQVKCLYTLCQEDVDTGASYEYGIHCNICMPSFLHCAEENKFFCSQHCFSRIMKVVEFDSLKGLDEYSVTPNAMHVAISKDRVNFLLVSKPVLLET